MCVSLSPFLILSPTLAVFFFLFHPLSPFPLPFAHLSLSLFLYLCNSQSIFLLLYVYCLYHMALLLSVTHNSSPSLSLSISRSLLTSPQTFNFSLSPSTNFSLSLLLTTPYFFPLINADFSGLQNCLDYFIPITVYGTFVRVRSVVTTPVNLVTVFWSHSV